MDGNNVIDDFYHIKMYIRIKNRKSSRKITNSVIFYQFNFIFLCLNYSTLFKDSSKVLNF